MTTREAAAAVFLSPKTIEYHLRNTYRKLGVNSREALAEALGEGRRGGGESALRTDGAWMCAWALRCEPCRSSIDDADRRHERHGGRADQRGVHAVDERRLRRARRPGPRCSASANDSRARSATGRARRSASSWLR